MLDRLRVRGRVPGLRTARTTLAATLAYAVALRLPSETNPVLAPLTALLVVQLTLYRTVQEGFRRVVSVVAGVLVAVFFAQQVGLTTASLAVVIAVSLVVGRVLRVGDALMEVPISAMLVLAVGGRETAAYVRIFDTLVGAVVGVAVSVVLPPPLYLQPAGDAVGDLADSIGRLLRRIAAGVATGPSREDLRRWLEDARELSRPIRRAERALDQAEESVRLHPLKRRVGHAQPPLRAALSALELVAVQTRGVCRSLVESPTFRADTDPAVRRQLALLLGDLARACDAFGFYVALDVAGPPRDEEPLRAVLIRARERHGALSEAMVYDVMHDPGRWRAYGSLLADLERLIHELDPESGADAHSARRRDAEGEHA